MCCNRILEGMVWNAIRAAPFGDDLRLAAKYHANLQMIMVAHRAASRCIGAFAAARLVNFVYDALVIAMAAY
jgi:hypothetical protein